MLRKMPRKRPEDSPAIEDFLTPEALSASRGDDEDDQDDPGHLAGGDEAYLYDAPPASPLSHVIGALTGVTHRRDTGAIRNTVRTMPRTRPYELEIGRVYLNILPLMTRRGLVARAGPKRTLGQPSPSALMHACGIEKVMCWQLVRHPKTMTRLDFKTLAKLCWGMGCQPGDILIYITPEAHEALTPVQQKHLSGLPQVNLVTE